MIDAKTNKKVLYIMGTGRSGTTLFDIILGNDDDVFSGGELNRFPKRNGLAPKRDPSDPVSVFWGGLKSNLDLDIEEADLLSSRFEYHTGFLSSILPSIKRKRYDNYIRIFFQKLFGQVTESIIVDSSKYPLRAYHLSRLKLIDYCIYVKKHPVSILRSFKKENIEQPGKSTFGVLIYLIVVHLISMFVIGRLKKLGIKVIEATLEEVTDNPISFVTKVEDSFNINLSSLRLKLESQIALKPGFLFDGNRIRLKREILIKPIKEPIDWSIKERFVYVCNKFWWKNKD